MFSFLKLLACVGFYCVFYVDFSTSIQGALKGKDDYITLSWNNYDPNFAAKVYCFGANIVSWLVNGTEYLFLSKNTPFDDKSPIIGGIPLVFPVYGNWTFGKDHGFSKNVRWEIWDPPIKDWDTGIWSMSFKTRDLVYTRHMWNYRFDMYYYVTINNNILTMTLRVHSVDLKTSFHFQVGFRNHIRVLDVTESAIRGLVGVPYYDKTVPVSLDERPRTYDDRQEMRISQWTDKLYPYAPNEIIITNVPGGRNLKISTINCPDFAVWHPWDKYYRTEEVFADGESREFIGIHTGVLKDYIKLGPNETYEATQIFELM